MFNRAEKIFAGAILIVGVVVSIVGYSFTGPSDPPKKIWFDTAGGDVIFDHAYHATLSDCSDCHHNYEEGGTEADNEMNCRSCHYFGEARESESEDPTHKRFIGANCIDCHKEMAMKVTCDACHIQQGLAFEASGRMMPPLPESVEFETDGGLVTFNHKQHISEDVDEPCITCHHDLKDKKGMEGLEREKRCRACHYDLGDKIPDFKDENHTRYIGANCTECHDAEDCGACHGV
ncbi:MAG: cytochrome c3 family protein [Deltaproteobacteria bacterium]|nr:MAG: cytochrome c3 family protein [Deltaproteobacteria bacterium]